MNIQDLPNEIQNKIFYYYAEHPCAKMIKDIYKKEYVIDVDYGFDEDGDMTLTEIKEKVNTFKISENRFMIYHIDSRYERYWDIRITQNIKDRKEYREILGDHYDEIITPEIINYHSIRLQKLMIK